MKNPLGLANRKGSLDKLGPVLSAAEGMTTYVNLDANSCQLESLANVVQDFQQHSGLPASRRNNCGKSWSADREYWVNIPIILRDIDWLAGFGAVHNRVSGWTP